MESDSELRSLLSVSLSLFESVLPILVSTIGDEVVWH